MSKPVKREIKRLTYRLFEIEEMLGVSIPYLRKEIREGRLPAYKLGGSVMVKADDLTDLLEKRLIRIDPSETLDDDELSPVVESNNAT